MTYIDNEVNKLLTNSALDLNKGDNLFYFRFVKNLQLITSLFHNIYGSENDTALLHLSEIMINTWKQRPEVLKARDVEKEKKGIWYTDQNIVGMSLYVDRFCTDIKSLNEKLAYLEDLGVNFIHLMPIMESPENESDGGYAVSDFKKVDARFGTMHDLEALQAQMLKKNMYLMMDVVINHTSHVHDWANRAKSGDKKFENYFYTFEDRIIPDQFEKSMPEIFPHSSPGNFTWSPELNKWVMTVFNYYQWDLNYKNPEVLVSMMETIFFYANLGVDILRVDAPAFIWKKIGTTCQNLDEAHQILKLFRACVDVAAPGMALLGEAIVAPKEIMKYFGDDQVKECSVAYNATQMALQWEALATEQINVMLYSQNDIFYKPIGCTWINYTRCHDDIGLGFSDDAIHKAGFSPYEHRKYLKDYFSGNFDGSDARGLLFGINTKTQDARISGTLASLCGLELALKNQDQNAINLAIHKILLMQANSIFLGGIPMLFYGDEVGYTNDYSYEMDPGKAYDNRWAHRPVIDWKKNEKSRRENTIEHTIFSATKKMIQLRKSLACIADKNNIHWLDCGNKHILAFKRYDGQEEITFIYNYSRHKIFLTTSNIQLESDKLVDLWLDETLINLKQTNLIVFEPFQFKILKMIS